MAAHPIRWRLLGELARSDRAVRELTALTGEPQNLVSYHLRELRDAGLVHAHRSSADGRASYYAIDLAHCRDLLGEAGFGLHPGLRLVREESAASVKGARVLFLCTGNGTRSQMAQALLAHMSGGDVIVASAGSHPKPVHPNAIRAMAEIGVDISANRSKHMDTLRHRKFDVVVTLCDRVREVCPEFPGVAEPVHWSIPDPGLTAPTDDKSYPAFVATRRELETRISFLLSSLQQRKRS